MKHEEVRYRAIQTAQHWLSASVPHQEPGLAHRARCEAELTRRLVIHMAETR